MRYKMISPDSLEMIAQFVAHYPEETDEYTVLVTRENPPQFYEKYMWLNRGDGPDVYMLSACPCDVSEAEWDLFEKRLAVLHGIKPLDNERTVKAVLRALERMPFPPDKKEEMRAVIGITPEQVAADPACSFMPNGRLTVETVACQISNYCMNEWDRRLLAPTVLDMEKGPMRLQHTNMSFARMCDIPVSVVEHVIQAVLTSQTVLNGEEEAWLRKLLLAQENAVLSWQEGQHLLDMLDRIQHERAQNEEEVYDEAAQAYDHAKDRGAVERDVFCAQNRLNYAMFWRVWRKKYPRKGCLHRSKKLTDFLD